MKTALMGMSLLIRWKSFTTSPLKREVKWDETERQHVMKNYNFSQYEVKWYQLLTDIHERHGSWETRKKYSAWREQEL